MTTYGDLTEYSYTQREPGVLNVGWLGRESTFEIAEPSPELLRALVRGAGESHNVQRGLHRCEFCEIELGPGVLIAEDGSVRYWDRSIEARPVWLGTGEIRVAGSNGVTYAAPTLVVHYVLDHRYAPPEDFVAAMLQHFGDHTAENDPTSNGS